MRRERLRKKHHRFISMLCVIAMLAGLINPMMLKATAVEVKAADGVIEISTPEELQKIGQDADYPLSGDYVLTADLDMAGIDFTPIGGIEGSKGTVSGSNVFSGTFDGQGHLIANLTINVEHTYNSANYMQIGMFSVIASANANDYAVVKNLVFANVSITTNITGGYTAAGTLAGEVNGYATVENIAVLDGAISVNGFNESDTVGAGGLIGECRTEASMGNNNITIKNIYNGAEVLAGSTTFTYYTGGIVGRVRGSSCKEISGCVNTGRTSYRGEQGSAITAIASGANASCIKNSYFLFATGDPAGNGTVELSEAELKSGVLPGGLDANVWYASEGSYPYLQICKNEGPSGYLGLLALSPEFAGDENASCVTQDFTVPDSVGDVKVTWTSSNTDVIEIEGTTAKVKGVMAATRVTLTAKTEDGKTRNYTIIVLSNVKAEFDQLYAKAGTPLTVSVKNAPADLQCTYTWSVGGQVVSRVSGNSYTPTESDNEKLIKVVVTATNYNATWEVSMYMSDLPVVYIDTEDGKDVINKDVYKYANIKIQGNDEFSTESVLYDGLTEIKGRGNSTWDYAASNGLKKPYRLKFDSKADVLGMGKSKHWVLLANTIDHTNMRNELIYQFADDIGMECVMSFEPCVVILNGEYRGFYQIGEHKRVDEGRIDIFSWESLGEDIAGSIAKAEGFSDADTSAIEEQMAELDYSWLDTGKVTYKGKTYTVSDYYKGTIPEFTGGFAFDMDFRLNQSKFISKFYTRYGYPMFFEAPEYAKTSPIMMEYAQTYLQAFEDAIHDDDFYVVYDGEEVHYSELYDIESLLQNWFVVEYTMNWDAMKNSTLMYKDLDTAEGRSLMKMGPVWDFDWCWGNMNMYSNTSVWVIEGWHTTQDSFCEVNYQRENWNRYLISDPYFAMLAYESWDDVRAVIEDMIKDGGRIDQLEEYYRAASVANDAKWGSTYNKYSGMGLSNGRIVRKQSETFDDAVKTMEYFIDNRVAWFDKQFTSVENLLASWGRYQGSSALTVSDVQFPEDGATEITASVTNNNIKKIAFYVNGIRAGEANVTNGTAAISVSDDMLRVGENSEAMNNCVQIRAMDANGNFLKSGSAVMTNYDIFEKEVAAEEAPEQGEVTDSVVINEVESSDAEGGNDWVEIYNKGDEAVDISGWFVTDDKGLDRLTSGATTPIAEGTILEPGTVFVLEENIDFTCGLGNGDRVDLYNADSQLVATYTWGDHALGTLARVPDGTGDFVDQVATKGTLNIPVVINEVESNDAAGGNDWVEIYNKGDKAIDISGWFVADDGGLDRLSGGKTIPLAEGTVLEPGAVFVFDEGVNFDCGLGGADMVNLYNAANQLVAAFTWNAHAAAGTYSRVPDGTGDFVDMEATKGALNGQGEDVPDPEPDPEPIVSTVVINEVESSDAADGNDWVEIYNKGEEAVDISGWFLTDDKGLNRLTSGETTPLADGTVLESGAVLVLEETIDFTCGLGGADTVNLYNAESQLADSYTWDAHAAVGTYARVPDGTGDFVDMEATKGALNIMEEPPVEDMTLLADFNFDTEPAAGEAFDGGNAQATGTYTLVDRENGKALSLRNGQFLTVTAKDGSSLLTGANEMTVSFLFKPERSTTNWAFFAAPTDTPPSYPNEHYIGIFDNNGSVGIERYDNNGSRPATPSYAAGYGNWYHVAAVLTAATETTPAESILYVNGVEVSRVNSLVDIAELLGENSVLYIGKATWGGGEFCTALIDNYRIYSRALTAEEVAAELVDKSALEAAIAAAVPETEASKYTEDSWAVYEAALEEAKETAKNKYATQEEVDEALAALLEAGANLKDAPVEPIVLPYIDVTEGIWYYDAVYYNFVEGLMTGKSATIFAPDAVLSRAEFASVLYAANDLPDVTYEAKFPDIYAEDWYADAVIWASKEGIVNGYGSGLFGPADPVAREQIAIMMYNYAAAKGYATDQRGDLSAFKDAGDVSWYAEEAMQWAVGAGVITGKDGGTRLDPYGATSRAECAAIMQKFMLNCTK